LSGSSGFLAKDRESRQHCGMRSFVLATLGVTSSIQVARAESVDDALGPRELAVGEAMRGGATGSSAIGLNPAGLPLNRELVFEGGYGYRTSDSASLVSVSACDSTVLAPGCFFYEYAGASPELGGMSGTRKTHVGGMTLARPFVPRVIVGATARYYDFESTMTGEDDASGFVFDVGATIRLSQMISVGVAGQNLWATEESPNFPRTLGGGVMARPAPSLAVTFDTRWKMEGDNQDARYGGGVEWFLKAKQHGFPLRFGALHDNGTDATFISGGIGYTTMKWGIDIGARRQVKAGDDTLVLASMRFFGPRLPAPSVDSEPSY
jgi:hypothetical protein